MSCADSKQNLPAMVLGDLEGVERDRVVAHLRECASCRAERAHLESVLQAAQRLPAPEPSGSRRERVVAAMAAAAEDLPNPATPRRGWLRFATAAAVLLAVFGTWGVATGRIGFARPAWELQAESVIGETLVLRAGGSAWEPLTPGTPVRLGDRVLTNGGRAWFRSSQRDLIVLADGSQIMISRQDEIHPSVMLVYGEIWAEVTPRTHGHLRFESPEGDGFAEVLGTKFHLEYR